MRVREKLEKALEEILNLKPTCEEIEEYAENAPYGGSYNRKRRRIFWPFLHDTWMIKQGRRVHIDIGCGGAHLMLDKYYAEDFIKFIKNKRGIVTSSKDE